MATITKQHNGSYIVEDIFKGQYLKRVYYGYTKKQALNKFNYERLLK